VAIAPPSVGVVCQNVNGCEINPVVTQVLDSPERQAPDILIGDA
jgi:hypothetical protein